MTRYYIFASTIILGLAAVLYLGWGRASANVADAEPSLLRDDFRGDYALMVAEAFAADNDVDRAEDALAFLDADDALAAVEAAIEFGAEAGFSAADLELLDALADALATLGSEFVPTDTP